MNKISHYTDILAWQKAQDLAILVHILSKSIQDYSFADQIKRASVSVMNNIAEGYGRYNRKEFKQFLSIAKGSVMEVQSMVILGERLKYITPLQKAELYTITVTIDRLLKAFITSILVHSENKAPRTKH